MPVKLDKRKTDKKKEREEESVREIEGGSSLVTDPSNLYLSLSLSLTIVLLQQVQAHAWGAGGP